MSERVKRAQELRARRKRSVGAANAADMEDAIEMSATSTLACIFLLLSIGASMASSYIMIHNPGCMDASAVPTPSIRGPGSPKAAPIKVFPPAPPPLPPVKGMPAVCTAEQLAEAKKQLPPDACSASPWTQGCSLTRATTKCKDPFWWREFYASATIAKFNAVFVGCSKQLSEPMEALRLGSHNTKYDVNEWFKKAGIKDACPAKKAVTPTGAIQPVQAYCLETDPTRVESIKTLKTQLALGDEFQLETTAAVQFPMGIAQTSLDKWIPTKFPGDEPIHLLTIHSDTLDYSVLAGGLKVLSRVRYMEFGYHWQGGWGSQYLSDLVKQKLRPRGFACYWHGSDGNLWRLTDCWQAHYDTHWWANLVCVNTQHEDTKGMKDKMEELFLETLKKTQKFGD